jgi:hypothetical protein
MAEGKKFRLGRGLEHLIAKGMASSECNKKASAGENFTKYFQEK